MMQTANNQQLRYEFYNPTLPLAVYREVVAHLQQVSGVEAGLLPQPAKDFDYTYSQVGGLWLEYPLKADQPELSQGMRRRIDQILAYYSDRYGAWKAQQD
ncbi:hypothetical protein [Trichocoleus sp. FACHB-591]|uniref:hypothetical protein n=1 Tax=Trichocoleus sp. FACHB-591 TaxID=2692872 RepID=UPI001F54F16A|nr:hypothetical protein [Trichocoleus sp. FACHB-591]